MQYLMVILDEAATSFCCYSTKACKSRLMDLDILRKAIRFAQMNGLYINFLLGTQALPKEYIETMDVIRHVNIVPSDGPVEGDDVVVINYAENGYAPLPPLREDRNVILRMDVSQLSKLGETAALFKGKCKRLNISLLNIDRFLEFEDNTLYLNELYKLVDIYLSAAGDGHPMEINLVSDRLFLDKMNNCEAGVKHITLAPDGNFYVCPAFYYEGGDNIGSLDNGLDIKNKQLFQIEYSPICRVCDAFHCKRCIWMNSKTTTDVNTPSHEQCLVSHLERVATKELLTRIQSGSMDFRSQSEIPDLGYVDPFDIVNKWKHN